MEKTSSFDKAQKFLTGFSGKKQIKLKNLISSIFKRHSKDEYNEILDGKVVGTNHDKAIITDTPQPWIYSRVFAFIAIMYALLFLIVLIIGETPFAYLTLIAASLIPVTLIVFLSELNCNEPISFLRIVFVFLIGIIISLGVLAIIPTINFTSIFLNCLQTGIVEEVAKIVPIFIVFFILKPKRLSSGLLIGFIVGAGFEISETMGYSTFFGYFGSIVNGTIDYSTMFARTIQSIGSHSFYACIEAGAIMLSLKKEKKYFQALLSPRFWTWVGSMILIHTLWNFAASTITALWLLGIIDVILAAIPVAMMLIMLDASIKDNQKAFNLLTPVQEFLPHTEAVVEPINNDAEDKLEHKAEEIIEEKTEEKVEEKI